MDPIFWLALLIKMMITAALVVTASVAAERSGPLIGAMVATLPISAAPTYAFLALDHDSTFIAASALASLTCNAANALFCAIYTVLAQRSGLALSLSAALGSWILLAFGLRLVEWTLMGAILFNIVVFIGAIPIGQRYRNAAMPPSRRRWYDVPFRAAMVATMVVTVVGLSARVGPTVTGMLALFPIVLVGLVLIFHARIGGPATAAITANAIPGLAGFGVALIALHLLAVPAGSLAAIALALGVSIAWNLMIVEIRRRGAAA
jgi:hypothetical protein